MKLFIFLLLLSGIKGDDNISTRIVGGQPAASDRFPYYSSLYTYAINRNSFFCGGILVAPDFVLTAAHCNKGGIKVVTGNTKLSGDGTRRNVKKKFRHEMYKETTIENDIMLLQLSSPVPETPAIMNFDTQFPVARELLTTVGLGRLDENLPSPEILHYVRKNEFPFSNCRFKYSNMDRDLQICAGGDGEKDSCFGDSGGPLVKEGTADDGEADILVGLTSYGRGCARPGFPGIYTRISGYEDWIKTRICGNTAANPKPDYCDNYVAPPGGGVDSGDGGGIFGGSIFCFSSIDTVQVEHVGPTTMKNLKIGDSILVAPNKYESVYSFGHRSDSLVAQFLSIVTNNGAKLEITKDHLVFIDKDVSVPASDLKHGMKLLHDGELTDIKSITKISRKGLYAPFTPSGKLVVNGFDVSSFVAINGSATFKVFGMELHYHTFSTLFESPRRVVCHVVGGCSGESYGKDGVSTWHSVALNAYQWLLDRDVVTFHIGFMLAVAVVGLVSVFECIMTSSLTLPLLVVFTTLMISRKAVCLKSSK